MAIHLSNGRRERYLLLFTAVFVFTNAASLSLVDAGQIIWSHYWGPAVWLGLTFAVHLILGKFKPARDPILFPLVALLTGWGILLIDRLASNFLARQIIWISIGTGVLLLVAVLPRNLRILRQYRYTLLISGLFLLAATFILGVNPSGFGETLWLPIPFLGHVFFQPSELLKLLLVIFLASYFDDQEPVLHALNQKQSNAFPYLAPLLLMWGLCMLLLIWQQDLGTATLFFIVFLALLYVAAGDIRYVLGGAFLLAAAGLFAYQAFDKVVLRIDGWLNPWPDAQDRAFQIVQSLYALANGRLIGQGIGQGFPDYIPVVHSDFVFAAIAEEWGLIGSLAVLACFAILAYRGMRIASRALRPFHRYLASGISILFAAQAILIMGGVTRLLPLTGVTLPFVSYGGSSLLVSAIMFGLLLFVSAEPTIDDSPSK